MCSDGLMQAVRPILATSGGRLLALSTPCGRRGWWYDAWTNGGTAWKSVCIPASACSRIPAAFLEEERRTIGERFFLQEYCGEFMDMIGAVFSAARTSTPFSAGKVQPVEFPA